MIVDLDKPISCSKQSLFLWSEMCVDYLDLHSGLLGGGRVIFDPIFFCQFFASLVLFIHISFRKNMFGNIYVKKNSKFWSQKVLKKAILHCKNG